MTAVADVVGVGGGIVGASLGCAPAGGLGVTVRETLIDAASGAGATVLRGVRGVELSGGPRPTVTFAVGGETPEVEATLVGRSRRPGIHRPQAGAGPETIPPELVDPGVVDRMRRA